MYLAMYYLYHSVPKDMSGTVLEPLNILKHTKPDLYAKKVQKYTGREHVMERHVPRLNCLWNDVLHLSPVEPMVLKQALLEAGREDGTFRFYQIDPDTLEPENTAVYLFRTLGKVMQPDDAEFIAFSPEQLEQWQAVPDRTKQYFKGHYELVQGHYSFMVSPTYYTKAQYKPKD